MQIDYDPTKISYEELLQVFWSSHNPSQRSWSKQYMTAVFYRNEEQKRLAEESKKRIADALQTRVYTRILPATRFYVAEEYHQKYGLRHDSDLMAEFSRIYPDDAGFMNSTAAARVNGYLTGYGTSASLEKEIDMLGLSKKASARLLATVKRREKRPSSLRE